MMIYRKLSTFIPFICFVCALVGCGDTQSHPITPKTQSIQQAEIQLTPTTEVNLDEFQMRLKDGMKEIYIPRGEFQMGSTEAEIEDAYSLCQQHYHTCNRWYYNRENPLHSVSLDGFWIDQSEISNAQYRLCVDAGICSEPTICKKGEPTFDDPGKENHPVVCVNWEEAQSYCQWVGSRLPTEAEWEYAFRGDERSIYSWGNQFDGTKLNYCDLNCSQPHKDVSNDDGYPRTAPVKSFPSGVSWSGLYNMSGNVSEWVVDWLGDYSSEALSNPLGPSSGIEKIIKGCSWFFHPTYCRGAARHSVDPETRIDYLGFRCVSGLSIASVKNPEDQISISENISVTAESQDLETSTSHPTAASETVSLPPADEKTGLVQSPPEDSTLGDGYKRSSDGMNLLYVPAGSFKMGGSDNDPDSNSVEFPQHEVSLDSFWMDYTEVTNAQYTLCVDSGMCRKSLYAKQPAYNGADHPVVGVSWGDAVDYCAWVGGRLPTEAEWEYAAKGLEGNRYPWGDIFDGNNLNFCDQRCSERWADPIVDDGYGESAPVGSYPDGKSWVGALDLAGNVWEWAWDWYADYTPDSQTNPEGPENGTHKIIRGGAWASPPEGLRTSYRMDGGGNIYPTTRHPNIGFRCVVPVNPETEVGIEIDPLKVPLGIPPEIDGILSSGEWDGALVETFADGSKLYLLQTVDYLYLGIQANTFGMIAGNLFIHQGNEIAILHSSAALGTAIYLKDEYSWKQIQDFTWCCRSTGNSESAQIERVEFLHEEGWLAANGRMGTPNELEYQIKIADQNIRISTVYIKGTYPYEKVPWPADLDDDCILPTPGGLPEELYFSPGKWRMLDLIQPGN